MFSAMTIKKMYLLIFIAPKGYGFNVIVISINMYTLANRFIQKRFYIAFDALDKTMGVPKASFHMPYFNFYFRILPKFGRGKCDFCIEGEYFE